jgi:hypothetical protein
MVTFSRDNGVARHLGRTGAPTRLAAFVLATAASSLLFPGLAESATYEVNSTADAADANTADSSCDADPSPSVVACTLRASVQQANASGGPDAVDLPAGSFTLTIAGRKEAQAATGDLDLASDLTVVGEGARQTVVDGGELDRVFDVASGAIARLEGLAVTNGKSHDPDASPSDPGTGPSFDGNGGGIRNAGMLAVVDSAVYDNTAQAGIAPGDEVPTGAPGGITHGAGVHNTGSLDLVRSLVSANAVTKGDGGGIWSGGGSVSLRNSTVSGNNVRDTGPGGGAGEGGGVFAAAGSLILRNATVAENVASDQGLEDKTRGASIAIQDGVDARAANSVVSAYGGSIDGCRGQLLSEGHNVAPGTTCGLTTATDRNLDPQLDPLQDNGGPTDTHALGVVSPAIDAADFSTCPSIDQRGVARPIGAGCDVGAYEAPCNSACGPPPFGSDTPLGSESPPKSDRSLILDANTGKVERGRAVRLSGQVVAPADEAGCEPNQRVELQRRKKSQPDSAFSAFESMQTDAAGNFAGRVKVRNTYVYRAQLPETEACDDEVSNTKTVRVQKSRATK